MHGNVGAWLICLLLEWVSLSQPRLREEQGVFDA
jgi:hypothetical protein